MLNCAHFFMGREGEIQMPKIISALMGSRVHMITMCCVMLLVVSLVFSGCSCTHDWSVATCEEAAKCSRCDDTQGEPQGHTWSEASCVLPKTCSVCEKTEGEALGHTWIEANYELPRHCNVCGQTDGEPLPIIQAVAQAYEESLALAKLSKEDQNYAYIRLHDEMFKLLADTSIGVYDKEAIERIFGEVESQDEAIKLLTETLKYVLSDGGDYLSALMRQFSEVKSVTGTITTTHVDIVTNDVSELLTELHIRPDVLGRILAMLDIYDYTWLSDNSEPLLQFTEYGFTYRWESVAQYVLNLQYQGMPLTEKDFIIRILDEGEDDMDVIDFFMSTGRSDGVVSVFDDKNMAVDEVNYYEQNLTDRGIYIGSTLDSVLLAYGQAELIDIDKCGIPHASIFRRYLDSEPYLAKLFEKQCKSYVMYNYKSIYDICICFDDDRTVSWINYFYIA